MSCGMLGAYVGDEVALDARAVVAHWAAERLLAGVYAHVAQQFCAARGPAATHGTGHAGDPRAQRPHHVAAPLYAP